MVALWVVFDLRLRHGFRFDLPEAWFGVLGAAATLPVAVRRIWPIPVLAVVTTAVAALTALGRAELDLDIMLGMAIYTVAVTSRRPVAVAALVGTEAVLISGLIAASAGARGPADTAHSLLPRGRCGSSATACASAAGTWPRAGNRKPSAAGSRSARSGSGSPGSRTTWWPTR